MDRTANQSTSLRTPWREALKRAGSFDELRPCLHAGQIPAHHGGLYALSDSNQHSGPGILRPEKWAHAYEDRAGRRVIFITDEVVFGQLVREQVFAYDRSIELDSVAFDTFFPVAGLPPATPATPSDRRLHAEGGSEPTAHAKPAAAPRPGGRKPAVNWEMVEAEIFRLMNHHGEFSPDDDPEWNAQARLEAAIADFCQDKFNKLPGETQIREHVRPALKRWRRARSET